ncbi:hypothetical protein HO173_011503 [Letharia columbiana]|uniref:Uncharacterized protein n=1 Tax=Letharia columbiana TaxID=112416 RepID=A0A8H6FJ22_9LECA|nr:uncharacterized protein HO173_011503 [Letharia columbiana]KAF6229463.1 hypothetical protein HO173_011503 [Letharia columbiana]
MIHLRVEIEQLAAAKRQKKDKAQISELRHQVKLLKSQLRNERSTVKGAIIASSNIAYHIQGRERSSVNERVATKACIIATEQLEEHARQSYQERDRQPVTRSGSSTNSSATSSGSSPRLGIPRSPSPPTSPPPPRAQTSHTQPLLSKPDADRREFRIATNITTSGKWDFGEPGTSSNTRVNPPSQGNDPVDVNDSIKDQNARNRSKRTEHGSRVRDETMNAV